MRFIDEVEIHVSSGNGGRGASSMRRESFVPMGGPDGGDGGRGGHILLVADPGLSSLMDLRQRPIWRAQDGESGGPRQMTGGAGEDLKIFLPIGTIVRDAESDVILLELTKPWEERILAEGGKGGLGNIHFKTSTNRAPRTTTPGGKGQSIRVKLELKLMADVGLLGFPNAGKSTLISTVSAAKPQVAPYPFTTLTPHLGVVSMGFDGGFVMADIPGIIEGAAEGKGLGHQFLRHVERTRLLLHLLSLAEDEEAQTPAERYRVLRTELEKYDDGLASRPELVVLTKRDTVEEEAVEAAIAGLKAEGVEEVRVISAATGAGVKPLMQEVWQRLQALRSEG